MWFNAALDSRVEDVLLVEGDFIQYQARGTGDEALGTAIGRITTCYSPVKTGRFVDMTHMGAENPTISGGVRLRTVGVKELLV